MVKPMNRRRFLQSLLAATSAPALSTASPTSVSKLGPLRPDPDGIIDLPAGFSYRIVSRAGDMMSDGLRVPHAHDGMAAFPGEDGRIILVCNHELGPENIEQNAFGTDPAAMPDFVRDRIYDAGLGRTPGNGGTTTTVYNPATGETERQHLSLVGTEYNCAGGPTPWRSWLSCEEAFRLPGKTDAYHRERAHGYVFEVSADATGLVEARPITAMGRFEHEAAAVHVKSGIVYMTEDWEDSLFYRFIPDEPGNLHAGGQLQALATGKRSLATDNHTRGKAIDLHDDLPVHWVDLDDVDSDRNDLRLRGAELGAATFRRGEGLCAAGDDFYFTATTGGPAALGQVFRYRSSPVEGTPAEREQPGLLRLVAEADAASLLRHADNVVMGPGGDVMICEDTATHCGIVGMGPDGMQYAVADNAYSDSELAGACFSPDRKTLFVNIQYPGMTLAITGPWPGV